MYYEIEGRFNMKNLVFDDEKLTVGDQNYPYAEIDEISISGGQLFAVYGILTIRTHGKDISIPYARSATEKLRRAVRELERRQSAGETDRPGGAGTQMSPTPADPYEEARKLKELLDLGILTEEEFQKKKKEILGL